MINTEQKTVSGLITHKIGSEGILQQQPDQTMAKESLYLLMNCLCRYHHP